MSSNGRPVTQTFSYEATIKDGKAADERVTGHAQLDNSVTLSPPPLPKKRTKKSTPFESLFPKPNQGGSDVTVPIGVDDTDRRKRVAIKRVRKPGGSVHQVPPSTCDQIVNIKDMYVENGDVVFIYEQMDVSLRHMTGILQDQLLKAFQIAAICREVSAIVDQAAADHAHGRAGGERPLLHTRRAWSGSWRAQLQHGPP